ncbi:A/G-specific adenine glycosylase [Peloplasma aerotolerans]|uniref:Adenine DNA glycosylase n=1 Tax=Peloplasma aerotolerans TaxID=3044389 RepID=A0AAW6U269_9MOLU|nr:A/G-specific adenine glycosylase [Mariniplasma sp. M4Ah]MDI6452076.1 A/G-specific adenine glycosylase [Mariniplasma sp. M4Ah]MDR4969027.1 A/G-specific adenine glycosylase [Acholeplasmataceae bacterium]
MNIKKLEAWYEKNHRKLVFRESNRPYDIWVSEVMLQQTQVETVLPFFERFMKKYPTVLDLADAKEETLQKAVEGLGYYRRFRNMHLAAKIIKDKYDGKFPSTYEEIIKLPGIGKYTAGAIMSIAYHQPYSALDGNVIRVLSRYLGNDSDMRVEKNKKALDQINQSYIEQANPNVYTQAMMELGALVCRPKNPKCETCPLQEHCFAYQNDLVDQYPVLSKLNDKKEFNYITLLIHSEHGLFLRKRDEELLKGMYEYPQFESESINSVIEMLEEQDIILDVYNHHKTYKHVFTHQVWHMDVYEAKLISGKLEDWICMDLDQIHQAPMAVAHKKIKK